MKLSQKQSDAWYLLEDSKTTEVLYGGAAGCFVAGTLVNTISGHKPIESISIGEHVLSLNEYTGKQEYRRVVNTFTYGGNNQSKNIIIFELKNGLTIKCTDNHEFYIKRNWVRASRIASRKMGICEGHIKQIFDFKQGQAYYNWMEGNQSSKGHEASVRCERIFENLITHTQENKTYKIASFSSPGIHSESIQLSTSKSFRLRQGEQLCRKFGMDNPQIKRGIFIQSRKNKEAYLHQFCKGVIDWNGQIKRRKCKRNQGKIQTENLYKKDAGGRIWGSRIDNKRRDIKTLEAREIDINEIVSIGFSKEEILVYDLCVEYNHNYTVTTDNIIVHNSGKSMLGAAWHIYRRLTYPGSRGLIGRAKIQRLEESTLVTLFEVASRMGYRRGVDFKYNEQKHKIIWKNGSESLLKDLFLYPSDPEFTSLGSTEYTDAFIDECPEITLKAKQIVSTRLRWKIKEFGLIPKLLMTCNPTPGWVKEEYISDDNGKQVVLKPYQKYIHATLDDNPDEHFRMLYGTQLDHLSDYDKRRLRYGDWNAKPLAINPFAIQWNDKKHGDFINICRLKKDKILYLSLDFNINPFACTAWHLWEDHQGWHAWCVDEISIPKGNVIKMAEEIKLRYNHWLPTLFMTGDPMGNRGDIGQIDNASNYTQIQRFLNLADQQLILPAAPTHENSRADVNYVLYHHPDFQISQRLCPKTVADMKSVEIDSFGKIKKLNRNMVNQQADLLDTVRYFTNTFLKDWITQHQNNILPLYAHEQYQDRISGDF